ncbi:MAG: DUF4870 domain-containing protein [Deltaproteobacteria bacterium]|nr:DUF4870 domain-containing protein [Deltaproteobacteria bacterium]
MNNNAGADKQAVSWATICHLSALAQFLFLPYVGNILGPLIVWLVKRHEFPLVDEQGKEVLNFQISYTIYSIVSWFFVFIVIGIPMLLGLWIAQLVFVIIAAVKTSNGEHYKYPFTIKLIK